MSESRFFRLISFLAILFVVYSCSVEKNTNLSRFFHNLTSNYNIYFNGYQSYLEGMKRIEESNRDDYTGIMPIFEYSNPDAITGSVSSMDRAIQKASKLISLHSMTAKPEIKNGGRMNEKDKSFYAKKEYNNWVDDSYLLMGKAQLCKHEFDDARITFMHNARETDDEQIRLESTIWLARTYSEMKNYSEALRIINEVNEELLPQDLVADYWLTMADIWTKQSNWENATVPLSSALNFINDKRKKSRLTYILARLYEETGNQTKAGLFYRQVLKLNPPYELEFNARINQAGVFDIEHGDKEEMDKQLHKLLKDAKNKEYHDQIYFALGNLSMRDGETDQAIEYFHLSASSSTINNTQKGKSYLILADHYFEDHDYLKSQVYYDSAVYFLDKNWPGYDKFYSRSLSLNELSGYMSEIHMQDSLQNVASLPEPQRDALIQAIIRKVEKEERDSEMQLADRYNMGEFYENERRFRNEINASGKWYFYNQSALTFGRSEFRNRWGNRKLEDNWRRANKSTTGFQQGENTDNALQSDTSAVKIDNKNPEFYLRNLPLTDSLMNISLEKVASSLFNSGKILGERIGDREMANVQYNDLLNRFPSHLLVPQTLYNLYKLNIEEDPGYAQQYRDRLVEDYPESEFASILTDPEFFNRRQAESLIADNLYNKSYTAWKNEQYDLAVSICDSAMSAFPDHELYPKFMLLRAYSLGTSLDKRELKDEMNKIISRFPGSEEGKRASEIVAFLNKETPELQIEDDLTRASEIYSADTTGQFSFIAVIKSTAPDINRLTFDVINFNIDNYTNQNYSARGELVNDDHLRIIVGTFPDFSVAMEYLDRFNSNSVFTSDPGESLLTFIISAKNLETLNSDKDPGRYYLFFKDHFMAGVN